MPEAMFDDLPILGELGDALRAGMERAEATAAAAPARTRRRPGFGWLGTFLLVGLVGTTAAAGTLTLLRGSPIPGPKAEDTQPSMAPRTDSLRVLGLRAPDPDGGHLPFTLRTGESEAGQICATVGQADGDDFGIVGQDGRFREVSPGIVDGCGDRTPRAPAVIGVRTFDADEWSDVRSVVYGAGAGGLQRAELRERGRWHELPMEDGAFVASVRGYPEDSFMRLRLTYADGRETNEAIGRAAHAIEDPDGAAWSVSSFWTTDGNEVTRVCSALRPLRAPFQGDTTPVAPLCGPTNDVRDTAKPAFRYLLTVRTLQPGDAGSVRAGGFAEHWRWQGPARTLVWGWVQRSRIRRVVLIDGTVRRAIPRAPGGALGLVLKPPAHPEQLRLELELRNGRRITLRGQSTWKGTDA